MRRTTNIGAGHGLHAYGLLWYFRRHQRKENDVATPDRDSLTNGLVSIGEEAVAKSNNALLDDYFTDDDYKLHSPPGTSTATRSRRTSPRCAKASRASRSAGCETCVLRART